MEENLPKILQAEVKNLLIRMPKFGDYPLKCESFEDFPITEKKKLEKD